MIDQGMLGGQLVIYCSNCGIITEKESHKPTCMHASRPPVVSSTPIDIDVTPIRCVCPPRDLFNFGCKCGASAAEKARKG